MKEKRLYWKRIVAVVCAIVTLANLSYSGIVLGATTETSPFLDLTFHDFGVADNTYAGVSGTYHNAETLIGTRISGYVTLNEDLKNATGDAWLSFGYNGWGGLMLYFKPDGSLHLNTGSTATANPQNYVIDPANIASLEGKNFCGTRFKLALSMEAADLDGDNEKDDVLVKLYINDEIAIANPTGNDTLYGSNGEYYILDADTTHFQGYLITQQVGVEGFCSDITLESIDVADTTPYEIKTLTDFGLSDNTLGDSETNVEKSGSLGNGTLENLLIEGTYNFSAGSNMLFFGGAWSGFYIQVYNGNTLLLFYKPDTSTDDVEIGSITETEIGSFVGTDLPISVGFRFTNKTSTTADVIVSILIRNEYEYQYRIQGATLASLTDTLHFYAANGWPMSYSSSSYTTLSVSDFGMEDITTTDSSELYSAASGNLDHVIVNGFYTFADTSSSNAVYFGTTWQGFRIDNRGNNTLGFMQVDLADSENPVEKTLGTISGNEIGLKLTEESIKIQVSFAYLNESDGVADVRTSIVFDDTYRVVYTMEDMHTDILTRKMFLWSAGSDTPLTVSVGLTPSPKLVEVTPADFGISDNTYVYNNNDLSARGALTNFYTNADEMSVNGKMISVDVAFLTSGPSLRIGGNDGMGWNGVQFARQSDTQFQFAPTEDKTNLQSHTLELSKTGLTSISEEFNLKISFEYIDHDGDGDRDDVRYGVWFNNRLYDETYFYSLNDAAYYGNWFGVYCPTDGNSIQISSAERTISEYTTPYILEDFGVKTETYNQALIDELGTVDSYSHIIEMDMDDVSISGRISVSEGADIRLFGKGAGNNLWEGYRFHIGSDSCLNLEHTCSEDTDNDEVMENTVSLRIAFSEIQADEMFDFTLAQTILDADADGNKDDVRLGVWINDKLYENRYYYLLDFSEYIQGGILIYPGAAGQIVVEDSVDAEIYNLANSTNVNGYLIAGKGNLTVNQVACNRGDTLSTPGDYIVRSGEKGTYVKQVVLYKSGDTHPDGAMDSRDLVAVMKAMADVTLDTHSGEKAADVNADGKTDELDCESVRKHLTGEKTIIPVEDNFVSYDEDVMPIGAFFGPYRATVTNENYDARVFDTLTDDIFKKIQDLGVNLITYTENNYVSYEEDVVLQLELAEKYGIDVYLKDPRLTSTSCGNSEVANYISDYIEYDSFKGLAVIDEPNTDYYGGATERMMTDYAPLAAALNSYCNLNGKINLNPKTSTILPTTAPSTWPSELEYNLDNAYEKYVEDYIETCNAKVLSTDFYVFDHLTTGSTWKTIDGYFDNLEVMRKNSVEHGVAFWNYIQAGSYFFSTAREETANDTPNEAQMLWNVNTSLAYGAKGIQYFTLIQPHYFAYEYTKTWDWSSMKYVYEYSYDFERNGLIGANGEETSWYWYAQKANKQIAAVDEVLMHTTSQDVLAVGTTAQEMTGKSAPADSLAKYGLDSIAASNGAVVGVFDYQGKTAFYVVNYDYASAQDITLTFSESQSYSVISEQLSEANAATSGSSCTLKLNAGGAALVIIN